jgi:hypothetical protein
MKPTIEVEEAERLNRYSSTNTVSFLLNDPGKMRRGVLITRRFW